MAWHRSRQYTTTKAKEVAKELSLTIQAACWLWPAPGGRTLRLESCVAVILMDFADVTPRNNPASALFSLNSHVFVNSWSASGSLGV